MDISIEWLISGGVSLFGASFTIGYRYCLKQKEPIQEIKEFDCEIVHNEWVESQTYSGYPVILKGFKKAKATLKDGKPYWVECRHFRADGMMCAYTNEPCLLKHQLQNTQQNNQSLLSKLLSKK